MFCAGLGPAAEILDQAVELALVKEDVSVPRKLSVIYHVDLITVLAQQIG